MYSAVIIDDEKWVVKSLLAILQKQNLFEIVDEAYNGLAGLDLLIEKKPDLAFVDVKMPGLSGLELLQEINSRKLTTACIIISGHAEFAYVQKALNQNAIGYCLKPFSPTEIIDNVQRAYERIEFKNHATKAEQSDENKSLPGSDSFSSLTKNKIVQSILACIHESYAENISIQQIAKRCCVNPNYASQLFNQELGESFSSYLTNLRLQEAVKLLQTTDLPVSAIASQIGYRDYFYFAKVFKKAMHVTPTEYRQRGEAI